MTYQNKTSKYCAVPQCKNTSIKTPNKLFIYVPTKKIIRDEWLNVARLDPALISINTQIYFCEDHFDLPNDMDNYMQHNLLGSVKRVRIKPGTIPTKFEWQPDKKRKIMEVEELDSMETSSETSVLQIGEQKGYVKKIADKSIQVHMVKKFRSKASQTEIKFPKDESLRQQWINACGLCTTDELKNTKICSQHFVQRNYNIGGKSLRLGAVPSVGLPGPSVIQGDQSMHCATAKKYRFSLPHDVSEITANDFVTPEHTSRLLEFIQKTIKKKDKLIKKLETKTRHLRMRINTLDKLNAQLHKKIFINTDETGNDILETELIVPPHSPCLSDMKIEIELSETELILPDCLKGASSGANFSEMEIKQELLEPEEFISITSNAVATTCFSNTPAKKMYPDVKIKQEALESSDNVVNPISESLTDNLVSTIVKHKPLVLQPSSSSTSSSTMTKKDSPTSQDESTSALQKEFENFRILVHSLRIENKTLRKENNDLMIDLKNYKSQELVLSDK